MSNPKLITLQGNNASQVATWNNKTSSIMVYTEAEADVHVWQTILRDCNAFERLLELNLYIRVLSNTYPSPITDI